MLEKYLFMQIWKGGVGGISDHLCITLAQGANNCNLLVKRDLLPFNCESFIIKTVSYIMHRTCIQLISRIIQCTRNKSRFPLKKKEHIFNSISPSKNFNLWFSRSYFFNGQQTTNSPRKIMFTIGHILPLKNPQPLSQRQWISQFKKILL